MTIPIAVKLLWLGVLTTTVAAMFVSLGLPQHADAATVILRENPTGSAKPGDGGTKAGDGGTKSGDGGIKGPSAYLGNLYIWFLGFVGIAALFAMVYGGVLYMFSSTLTSTDEARRWIKNAIAGIVLAAVSYLLLATINPDLVSHGFNIEEVIRNVIQRRP
ncbi:MAG: hypothetical protein HY473_00330 [Candidatus Sungbacteria bacterium]|uniref:Uncharacterized protein n=1 Tax=Candidatus Sungiibacteriota bacterium TaxID=2750080 RepID=A0A932YYG5_9BACT|nr:hypothetical protein [Candidatus Sungbacteria bacterium]